MRKIRLELEKLAVESFDAGNGDGRGTVAGHNWTVDSCDPCEPIQPDDSINYCGTMAPQATCGATYCGSCYTCASGCWNTRVGWTCDPYAAECMPVPEG